MQGVLKALDQMVNLVLAEPRERIFSLDGFTEADLHGVFLVRGDTVAIVGELDAEADAATDWESMRVEPMEAVQH
jgi:U6 snRNA-associated Sm-like protein LSm8